jgi:hypothetical protein
MSDPMTLLPRSSCPGIAAMPLSSSEMLVSMAL